MMYQIAEKAGLNIISLSGAAGRDTRSSLLLCLHELARHQVQAVVINMAMVEEIHPDAFSDFADFILQLGKLTPTIFLAEMKAEARDAFTTQQVVTADRF